MMGRVGLYWRTARHLRPVQIYTRLWRRWYSPRPDTRPAPRQRAVVQPFAEPCRRADSMLGPRRFRFLNQVADPPQPQAPDGSALPLLWFYHLHYFDDLNAEGADARSAWHQQWLRDWIETNPPGKGVGWDPYPTSLRIVNWIKWSLHGGGVLTPAMLDSLAIQARWLTRRLEYHLLGNHLLANAKALVMAGYYFEGKEARRWYKKGITLLEDQVGEQILADGGHVERSPMYHHTALEDLLDIANILVAYERPVPHWLQTAIEAMGGWAEKMNHPDGQLAFFNDATLDCVPTLASLRQYAARLNYNWPTPHSGHCLLADSGYARLENEQCVALMDVAPLGPDYLPGHGHADTLSCEMSLNGQRVLVNSGVSEYGSSDERLRQRGTAAHNTVMLDGQDSSEVWSGFRVGRRARVGGIDYQPGLASIETAHDGYRHLAGSPVHRRCMTLQSGLLMVDDRIEGQAWHKAEGFWYLHPDVSVSQDPVRPVFRLHLPDGITVEAEFDGADGVQLEAATWHPGFGRTIPSHRIRFMMEGSLPRHCRSRFRWPVA